MEEDLLDQWDQKIHSDRLPLKYSGAYYKFETLDRVIHEGTDDVTGSDSDIFADTKCILTSCSKVFAGTAVMRTMHLKPQDWYPEKAMHEFQGWEQWKNFAVYENEDNSDGVPYWSGKTAPKVTVHQLLTHSNGWPFGLQGTRERVLNMPLYFEPGTNFGYSIGHRILGWMLLDYWKAQPEGRNFRNLNDVFDFLIYKPLGMTGTYFIEDEFDFPHSLMGRYFSMKYFDNPDFTGDDDPADLAMGSTGSDMMKLGMMCLRQGKLPDGSIYIGKFKEWAMKNQLPGGKLSSALAHWRMEGNDDINFMWRTAITRSVNAGHYGWGYFGGTYHDVPEDHAGDAGPANAIGWKGFSSCGVRADYRQNLAFVAMQECVPDPGSRNFSECFHDGKVGDYKLIDVALALEKTPHATIEAYREDWPKKKGLMHDVMTEVDEPNFVLRAAQNVVCAGYAWALPIGVNVLKFHKKEELSDSTHGHKYLYGSDDPDDDACCL
mmetsp:Transcript_33619/g.74899  ORF Transcript_33619/g.74899 Transcript_33619/m.74899 type:complete len:491 (+) Transcript_33619:47-1519(+)